MSKTDANSNNLAIYSFYDANGMRTSRTVVTSGLSTGYRYVYNGGLLMQEVISTTNTANGANTTTTTDTLNYFYDASGLPLTVTYNGTIYYYVTNLQGDVVALVNTSGTAVVNYTYDAWGNILSTTGTLANTLGVDNALRYRSYVYDTETEFYYLQSRYYNPEIGRFINADAFAATGQGTIGNNMFAYCYNSPVLLEDIDGLLPSVVTDKYIHDQVLLHICGKNPDLNMRRNYILYNGVDRRGGWGYCDLCNTVTGEAWELKKNSSDPTCLTDSALKQLQNYIDGKFKRTPDFRLRTADETKIESDHFYTSYLGVDYYVKYWDAGGGLLRYQYVRVDFNKNLSTYKAPATAPAADGAMFFLAALLGALSGMGGSNGKIRVDHFKN